jgi:chaperonin GroES
MENEMSFKPLGDRVLVQRVEEENKTASGIIIPDNAKEKPSYGVIKAVSNKVAEDGNIVLDDKVVFDKFARMVEISIDGFDYLVIETKDILGIMK